MRYIADYIAKDLKKKMVFIGGPRQVGKTTLALSLLKHEKGAYFNWDASNDRKKVLNLGWTDQDRLLIFDELHKYRLWRNWIKGIFDTQRDRHQFLVTGSARLDLYRRGGDSLVGRYHYWRLHPFGLDEVPDGMNSREALQRLMTLGGFPEPFLEGDETFARRWRLQRLDRVLRDDIRDLENLKDIQHLNLLVDLLRERVSSMLVISNLAEVLQISPHTVKRWLEALTNMYVIFIVRPFTGKIARSLQKAPKIYFFDNGDVEGDEGAIFENLVATHLLKKVHFWEDVQGYRSQLCFLRDKEKREVDFVLLKGGKVQELIEVKYNDKTISPALRFFAAKLKPVVTRQIVYELKPGESFSKDGIWVQDPISALSTLN